MKNRLIIPIALFIITITGCANPPASTQGEENLNPLQIQRSKDPQPSNEDYNSLPGGLSQAVPGTFQGSFLFVQGKPFIWRGGVLISGTEKIKNGTDIEPGDLIFTPSDGALEIQITGPGLSDGAIRLGPRGAISFREGQMEFTRFVQMNMAAGQASFNVFPDYLWTPFIVRIGEIQVSSHSNSFGLYANPMGALLATCKEGTLLVSHRLTSLSAKEGVVVRYEPGLDLGTYAIKTQNLQSFQDKWFRVAEDDFKIASGAEAGKWLETVQELLPVLVHGAETGAILWNAWEKGPNGENAKQLTLLLQDMQGPIGRFEQAWTGLWQLSEIPAKDLAPGQIDLIKQWKLRSDEGVKAWSTLNRWNGLFFRDTATSWDESISPKLSYNPWPAKKTD